MKLIEIKKKKHINKIIKKASRFIKIPFLFVISFALVICFASFVLAKGKTFNVQAEGSNLLSTSSITNIFSEIFPKQEVAVTDQISEADRIAAENERSALETKTKKILTLKNYLSDKASDGFINASETILNASEKCGVDYKLIVSIAGYESGYGKAPLKKYNPFGWLNGVQYSSWNEAIGDIICDFGSMYSAKGLTDPHQIVQIYVGVSGDRENWAKTVSALMKKVP